MKREAIDWDKGVEVWGGDEKTFREMVEKFEDLCFNQTMDRAFNAVMEMDFDQIWNEVDVLQWPYGFITTTSV